MQLKKRIIDKSVYVSMIIDWHIDKVKHRPTCDKKVSMVEFDWLSLTPVDRFMDRYVVVLSKSNMEKAEFMSMELMLSLDLSITKLPLSIIVLLSCKLIDSSIRKKKDELQLSLPSNPTL